MTRDVRLSKFLSLALRHRPEAVGLSLDAHGWASVTDVIEAANANGYSLDRPTLARIVRESDKQRFALDGARIRANQGHSVEVDLGLEPTPPPALLYHGTAQQSLPAIRSEGLMRRARHHVHLSADPEAARSVGKRHGTPVVLTVDAAAMAEAGHTFYRSANGVWLTDAVPPAFLDGFPKAND